MKTFTTLFAGILTFLVLLVIFGWQFEFFSLGKSAIVILTLIILVLCIGFMYRQIGLKMQKKAGPQTISKLQKNDQHNVLEIKTIIGVWSLDQSSNHILFYSPFFKNLLGYSNEEAFSPSFEASLHPNEHEKVLAMFKQKLLDGHPFNLDFRMKKKSGEYNWFQAIGQVILDQEGNTTYMEGSMTDINELKKAEHRLIAQYAVTKVLSEATSLEDASEKIIQGICEPLDWQFGSIWMVNNDIKKLHCIGTWHQPNLEVQQFEEMTRTISFSPNIGLPGRVWSSEKPAWIDDVMTDKNFPRLVVAKEAGLHSAFGFPILLQNNILGVLEIFTRELQYADEPLLNMLAAIGPQIGQFIQRKWTEKELSKSEAYKTAILEWASDSIMTINRVGTILSFNPQTERLFLFSKEELQSKNIDELMPGLSEIMDKFIGSGPQECFGVRNNQDTFPIELTLSKMFLNNEDLIVCVIRDITERKKVEKMKNEFISVVSHELRTPLTAIKGSMSLLLGIYGDKFSDKAKNLLHIANNNCERLIRLINDILDIEKIEAGKMAFKFDQINMIYILQESVKSTQEFARKFNVRLKITGEEDGFVSGDHDRLIQVITNLLSNAVKYSHENDEVEVSMTTSEDTVRVLVRDHGDGIPKQFQPKIFGKFAQADSSATRGVSGTGLGLSICKAIIESHHGKISFISKEQEGTTFYFDLPRLKEIKTEIQTQPTLKAIHKGLNRILICEDDKDCAEILRLMLEEQKFEVDIAYTAAEAKKCLANQHYAAMTLDILLPDENGIAFIKEMQEKDEIHDLPIVVISAIAKQGETQLHGNVIPVIGWIEKPIKESSLNQMINKIKEHFIQKKPLILHVDDDPDLVNITKSIFEEDATIINAPSLASAREWLTKEDFDLIILDLKLPDGSGAELLPCINWKTKQVIPVVVFSAYELDHDYAKYVYALLTKTTASNEQLLSTVKSVISKSQE